MTVDDLNLMTADELRTFLSNEKVQFSTGALKPELLATAREHVMKLNTLKDQEPQLPPSAPKAPEVKEESKSELPPETDQEALLRTLQAKGFRDARELREYLGVVARDVAALEAKKAEIAALYADLESRQLQHEQAKKDMLAADDARRIDIKKQADLYEKNSLIKDALQKAGIAGANM